jgi:hypothetical protein
MENSISADQFNSLNEKLETNRQILSANYHAHNFLKENKFDEVKINQGIILSKLNRTIVSKNIQDYEFKVFSQWGEDGIIQYLINAIEIKNKTFIEFGVEDFSESNCRFLLMNNNWKGFVLDGSSTNINRLKNSYYYWKYQIDSVDAFITKENINELILTSHFDEDLGILSIDLDGNDYFIFEAIKSYKPRIIICEYNATFGPSRKISVPYDPKFFRTEKHYSNLYFGSSLAALTFLAKKKGYSLVGTNSAGANAFFVRNDLLNEQVQAIDAEIGYTPSKFRESRDQNGQLTFISGEQRIKVISGLPVINVETNTTESL